MASRFVAPLRELPPVSLIPSGCLSDSASLRRRNGLQSATFVRSPTLVLDGKEALAGGTFTVGNSVVPAHMSIALESPDQPEVIELIAELDAYQDRLYPPESRHSMDLASLMQPNVLFAVARDHAGEAIGCGAVALCPAFGEIKRMYVSPHVRSRGVAKKLLMFLESRAIDSGCKLLQLETGPHQHAALALYAWAGYARRGPFGGYTNDPLSVFMQKHIGA